MCGVSNRLLNRQFMLFRVENNFTEQVDLCSKTLPQWAGIYKLLYMLAKRDILETFNTRNPD